MKRQCQHFGRELRIKSESVRRPDYEGIARIKGSKAPKFEGEARPKPERKWEGSGERLSEFFPENLVKFQIEIIQSGVLFKVYKLR